MKFGLFNLMSIRDNPNGTAGVLSDTATMIALAEQVGFDVAWFAEHHFTNYSISVSPVMLAAHFAATTKRIRLGTAVIVLPLYHPMRIAQEIALADQMSGGRLVLGVGSGYQPYEFDRLGADVSDKTELFLEYWEIVEQALTTGRVEFSGRHIQVPPSVVGLRAVDKRMPELYVTSLDRRVIQRLARHDLTAFITAGWRGSPALPGIASRAQTVWNEAGLSQRPMKLGIQQYIHVTESRSEALEAAERARFVGRAVATLRKKDLDLAGSQLVEEVLDDEPPLEVFRDNLLIGDAYHVAGRLIEEIRRFQPSHYNTFFQFGDMPVQRAARALERFGAEVLPMVEKELGPLDALGIPAAFTHNPIAVDASAIAAGV